MSTTMQKSIGLVVAAVATLGVLSDANAAYGITNVRVNANGIAGGGPAAGTARTHSMPSPQLWRNGRYSPVWCRWHQARCTYAH
jgi:hypothetical protein